MEKLRLEVQAKDNTITQLNQQVLELTEENSNLKNDTNDLIGLKDDFNRISNQLHTVENEKMDALTRMAEMEEIIDQAKSDIDRYEKIINNQKIEYQNLQNVARKKIAGYEKQIQQQIQKINQCNCDNSAIKQQLCEYKNKLRDYENEIQQLRIVYYYFI